MRDLLLKVLHFLREEEILVFALFAAILFISFVIGFLNAVKFSILAGIVAFFLVLFFLLLIIICSLFILGSFIWFYRTVVSLWIYKLEKKNE